MPSKWVSALGLALLLASLAWAQGKYRSPDSPVTHAAARDALSRAKILDIIGITKGIDSTLKDLGAKVTEQEIKIELAADVLFDFDKADLRPDAFPSLQKVAEVIKSYPEAPVLIEGHTDSVGADAYNQTLSENRALAVKNWLVEKAGVEAARISTRGWGESKPVAPNTRPDGKDDPEGRQKNRRVEITVKKG